MDIKNRHSASRTTRGHKSWWYKWNFSYADTKPLNQAGWTDEDWKEYQSKGKACQATNETKSNQS